MDYISAMQARKSVRNFDNQPLSSETRSGIALAINQASAPFGGRFTLKLAGVDTDGNFRPSTYGVITGARDYILVGYGDDPTDALSAGFAAEQVVIRARELGLDSCWIGGTFRGSKFASVANFPESTPLKAVIPVGTPAPHPGLLNRLSRAMAGSDKRKPLGELFFVNNFDTPITEQGPYLGPLSMMRIAPSSLNSQPWRALVRGNQIGFYLAKTAQINYVDMGIGLSHFDMYCRQKGIVGVFAQNQLPVPCDKGWTYVTSFLEG